MGGRARAGPRRGAGRDLPRARAGRARGADPGRPPPGAPRGLSRPPGSRRSGPHQADALEAARRGHAIVTTGTASGKSLAFNLPVLDTLASDVAARAFYLYPTKALAQDQARGLAQDRWPLPAPRDLRRRHAARGAARDQAALEPDPHEPGHAPRGRAAEPPLRGATCSPTSPGSWWTRRTCTAACSARTWRTCCGGCGGWRAPTAPSRASCSRARRSPTRTELAERLTGVEVRARGPRRRAARRAPDRDVEPAARGREARPARLGPRRGGQPARRRWSSARSARSAS